MTRNQKIVLGIVAALLILCLGIGVVGVIAFQRLSRTVMESAAQDPAQAEAMAREIADFTPPPGFSGQTGISLMGVELVYFNHASSDSILILMQMPAEGELTEADFDRLRDTMERQSGRRLQNLQTIEDREATIRGEPGRVVIQEGTNNEGVAFRQMMAAFQGKDGLAFLSVIGPADAWDQAAYDQMIESIR